MGQAVNPAGFRIGFTKPWPVQTSDFYGRPDETHFRFSFFFWELSFYVRKLFGAVKKSARRLSAKSRRNSYYFSSYFKLFEYSHLRVVSFFKFIRVNIFFFQPSLLQRLDALKRVISDVWKRRRRRNPLTRFVRPSVNLLNNIIFNKSSYKKVRRRGGSKLTRSQIYRKANRYVSSYRRSKFIALSPFLFFQPLLVFFRFLFFFYFTTFFRLLARLIKKFSMPFMNWFGRRLKVTFYPLKHYWCYPTIVSRFFARKIKNRRSPLFLVQIIKRAFFSGIRLFRKGKRRRRFRTGTLPLEGFRVKIAGRWTRQQMAQLFKKTYGRVSASSQTSLIDHYQIPVRMKNSSVGISISIQSVVLAQGVRGSKNFADPSYGFVVLPKFFPISNTFFDSTFSSSDRKRVRLSRRFANSVFKNINSYYDYFNFPSESWSRFCLSKIFSFFYKKFSSNFNAKKRKGKGKGKPKNKKKMATLAFRQALSSHSLFKNLISPKPKRRGHASS